MESLSKAKLKLLRSLLLRKGREEYQKFSAEGFKVVRESLNSGLSPELIAIPEGDETHIIQSIPDTHRGLCRIVPRTDFNRICATKNPEGILAVFPIWEPVVLPSPPIRRPWVLLDGINDPGNLGTIFRIADWFGIAGIILLPGCAEIFNPKTVRASMGSIFRVPFARAGYDEILNLGEYICRGGLKGAKLEDFDLNPYPLILFGSESHGISPALKNTGKEFSISGHGKAESLNVAIAVGITCWELNRQSKK